MESAEGLGSKLVRAVGLLAFLMALLLSIPGVHAVRASEPDMTPVSSDDFRGHASDDVAAVHESPPAAGSSEACGNTPPQEAQKRVARIALPQGSDGSVGMIVLNNRGYNYGSEPEPTDAQLQQIEREIADRSRQ